MDPGAVPRGVEPADLDLEKGGGLVTVVVQHARTAQVLMVAHADGEAIRRTVDTGQLHLRSRSRGMWRKGATSGNTMQVVALEADCDRDAVLVQVLPAGPACHTGAASCFASGAVDAMAVLEARIAARGAADGDDTAPSYTRRLLADRNLRLKKVAEEAGELVVACADADAGRAVEEAADLVYHALVAIHATGVSWSDVVAALTRRGLTPP